jgi:endonuclease/exonuclease/phosphatase (EEP) superfamily protein YafD
MDANSPTEQGSSDAPAKEVPDGNQSLLSTEEEPPVRSGPQEIAATGRWKRGTRLLVAATAVWTVFLVLQILFTDRWWPWSIFEATPPLTAVVVPLLLLIFVPFARPVRRWLAIFLSLLLLSGGYLAGYGRQLTSAATGNPHGTVVKVFSWNTGYWEMGDNRDAFYAFLRRQNADVYLLQEYLHAIITNGPFNTVIRIDDTARLRAEFPGYQMSVDGELLTLSRLPIVGVHHEHFSSTGDDWFWKAEKHQRTEIQVGGRTISFYNVHLPVPFRIKGNPLSEIFYRRLKDEETRRISLLGKLRTDLAGNPHPAVVSGDFNSPWMELSSLGAGTHVHNPPASLLPPRTFPVSNYHLPLLWHLDWLYTSGDLAVPSYHLAGGKAFSDHAAQTIRLVVPDETPSAHSR